MRSIFAPSDAPDSRELLGQKAANLVALVRLGAPVPPAFFLSTDAYAMWRRGGERLPDQLAAEIRHRLRLLLSPAGDAGMPALVSVRSGAVVSMPGVMTTLLDVGITAAVAEEWAAEPDEALARFRAGVYARFLRGFLRATGREGGAIDRIDGPPRARLSALASLARESGVPADAAGQVAEAVDAVFRSWSSPGAQGFRRARGLGDDLGTAVVVQRMVFGDRDGRSASGLVATRDPTTGARALAGGFLLARQGEEVVGSEGPAGLRPIAELAGAIPEAHAALVEWAERVEAHFGWPQDLEFTVESGRLWLLQARAAPLAPRAGVRVAVEMVREGLLTPEQAVARVPPTWVDAVRRPRFVAAAEAAAEREGRLLARGLAAAPGVACGPLVLAGEPRAGVLVRETLDPVEDLEAIQVASALVSVRGGTASHTSTLARLLDKPYVTGCERLQVDAARRVVVASGISIAEGTFVSVDGNTGAVFAGEIATEIEPPPPELAEFEAWQRAHRSASGWQAACYPERGPGARDHRGRAREILTAAPWKTAKAVAVDLVRELLPPGMLIPQFVSAARDRSRLRALMIEGLERGHWIGLRPCYSAKTFGKGTWQMAIRSPDEVDRFLVEPDFPGLLRSGGYPRWIEDPRLEEIICVWDPPGKGLPELAGREFAFSISCLAGAVRVEIVLGTAQIRYLEGADQGRLIHLRMELDHAARRARGRQEVRVGDAYVGEDGAVDRSAETVTSAVAAAVFGTWWDPPTELPHVMCALDDEVGLHGLEFQGRLGEGGGIDYMLVFDVKGAEESDLLRAGRS